MTCFEKVIDDLMAEVRAAEDKHPGWPIDAIHGAAIVAEESGEMVRAALQATYEDGSLEEVYLEATQTAATAVRMMVAIKLGKVTPGRSPQL